MLPTHHRLRDSADFSAVLRSRRSGRAANSRLVVTASPSMSSASRFGFVVSKAVGNAVVRNRTKRVLRHEAVNLVAALPAHTDFVVRALPPAGDSTAHVLRTDLRQLLGRAAQRQKG